MKTLLSALLALTPLAAQAKLEVVATLPDLAALAREVGGEHASVTTLAAPAQDPHYVDPRPSLILPLNRADLVVVNGLELEVGWLPQMLVSARNPKVQPGADGYLDASTVVRKLEVPADVDRARGDVHPGGNPHYTYDPRSARRVALALADRMAALDPSHAEAYAANARALAEKLDRFVEAEAKRFRALPAAKRRVVPYHASMPYLTDWLGLERVTHVEPKPGVAPSPGHVAKVLKQMKASGARLIIQEEFYPQKTSETLARLAGGDMVSLPGGTRFEEGQTYLEHMQDVTEKLYAALSR